MRIGSFVKNLLSKENDAELEAQKEADKARIDEEVDRAIKHGQDLADFQDRTNVLRAELDKQELYEITNKLSLEDLRKFHDFTENEYKSAAFIEDTERQNVAKRDYQNAIDAIVAKHEIAVREAGINTSEVENLDKFFAVRMQENADNHARKQSLYDENRLNESEVEPEFRSEHIFKKEAAALNYAENESRTMPVYGAYSYAGDVGILKSREIEADIARHLENVSEDVRQNYEDSARLMHDTLVAQKENAIYQANAISEEFNRTNLLKFINNPQEQFNEIDRGFDANKFENDVFQRPMRDEQRLFDEMVKAKSVEKTAENFKDPYKYDARSNVKLNDSLESLRTAQSEALVKNEQHQKYMEETRQKINSLQENGNYKEANLLSAEMQYIDASYKRDVMQNALNMEVALRGGKGEQFKDYSNRLENDKKVAEAAKQKLIEAQYEYAKNQENSASKDASSSDKSNAVVQEKQRETENKTSEAVKANALTAKGSGDVKKADETKQQNDKAMSLFAEMQKAKQEREETQKQQEKEQGYGR